MSYKILITIHKNDVAPRFDMVSEVLFVNADDTGKVLDRRDLVLPTVSAEELCHLILSENVDLVICGGIENEFYEFLVWKKVEVIDGIIGPYERALDTALSGELAPGMILIDTI